MAQKRMFDKSITNSDKFLEMPSSSQNLYFHLSMNADDDGFIDNWKSIMKMTGAKEDDLKVLVAKSYIIPFESGVIVIKHWRINNFLRKDRHNQTKYIDEYKSLTIKDNEEYEWLTNGQPSIDKNRIEKNRIEENNIYIVEQKNDLIDDKRVLLNKIITYLNKQTGSNYKFSSKKTNDLINARLREGFTEQDFYEVIDKKTIEWKGTDFEKFLRPETLFSNKFESYLNQKVKLDTGVVMRMKGIDLTKFNFKGSEKNE